MNASHFQVLASYGHVRDLAEKPGSVNPEADFEMVWSTAGFAGRQRGLADIVAAIKAGLRVLAWSLHTGAWYCCGMQHGYLTMGGDGVPGVWQMAAQAFAGQCWKGISGQRHAIPCVPQGLTPPMQRAAQCSVRMCLMLCRHACRTPSRRGWCWPATPTARARPLLGTCWRSCRCGPLLLPFSCLLR